MEKGSFVSENRELKFGVNIIKDNDSRTASFADLPSYNLCLATHL